MYCDNQTWGYCSRLKFGLSKWLWSLLQLFSCVRHRTMSCPYGNEEVQLEPAKNFQLWFRFLWYLPRILHDISCVRIHGFRSHNASGWKLLDFHRPHFPLKMTCNSATVDLTLLEVVLNERAQNFGCVFCLVSLCNSLKGSEKTDKFGRADLTLVLPYLILAI